MSRRPRVFAPGLLYHVIVRGNQRRKTFRSDDDYKAYLDRLEKYRAKCNVRIYAYCLMPNHVHLLVETGSTPHSAGQVHAGAATILHATLQPQLSQSRPSIPGYFAPFQGRYKAIICDRDKYLLALVRYIHVNPVRAKLAARPERYAYSGHNSYLTNGTAKIVEVAPILKLLGGKKAYERFVLEAIGENHNQAYYAVEDQRFLGEEGFSEELSRDTEQNDGRKAKKPIEATFKEIARRVETTPELLRGKDRRWDISTKRAEAVAFLVRDYGYAVSEVAKYLGRDQANISTMLSRLSARQTERSR
jgi:REP element-mobilizing transposase RayT